MFFSLKFCTIAAVLRWPGDCLKIIYCYALNLKLQDELASCGEAHTFEDYVRLSVILYNTVRERRCRQTRSDAMLVVQSPPGNPVEPMQLGPSPLTTVERHHCTQHGLCLYCGDPGHILWTFPVCPLLPEGTVKVGLSTIMGVSQVQFTMYYGGGGAYNY